MSDNAAERHLAAILAADMVGFSRLMGQDEAGTLAVLRMLRADLIDPCIATHKGRVFKTTGDGLLVEFPSVVGAVASAVAIQRAMAARNADLPDGRTIQFRIGVNLGDVVVDNDDLFGDGVNVAARLEAEASAGGIVISRTVHEAVAGRLKASFDDLGSLALKNIERPVHVFRVKWDPTDWRVSTVASEAAALDLAYVACGRFDGFWEEGLKPWDVAAGWLLDLFGLPPSCSVGFVTGGQMANFTGIAAGRHAVLARAGYDVEEDGLRGAPPVHVVVGAEAHVTILTALRLLGLGSGRALRVPADGQGRMKADELRRTLASLDGPTIVCTQAGNVNTGAFDPVGEISDIAHEKGAWVHVDGAFGLWAAIAPARAHLYRGVEPWRVLCQYMGRDGGATQSLVTRAQQADERRQGLLGLKAPQSLGGVPLHRRQPLGQNRHQPVDGDGVARPNLAEHDGGRDLSLVRVAGQQRGDSSHDGIASHGTKMIGRRRARTQKRRGRFRMAKEPPRNRPRHRKLGEF
jgi:class 3 adenylate cyclase